MGANTLLPRRGLLARTRGSKSMRSEGGRGSTRLAGPPITSGVCWQSSTASTIGEHGTCCEFVALGPDGNEASAGGTLDGVVAREPRGDEGFGYDPIFIPSGEERTVAELGNAWKAAHSARSKAARALAARLTAH